MKTLIVHVEIESPLNPEKVEEEVSGALEDLRDRLPERDGAFGWRFFTSLGEAEAWQDGPPEHQSTPNGCEGGCPACEPEVKTEDTSPLDCTGCYAPDGSPKEGAYPHTN